MLQKEIQIWNLGLVDVEQRMGKDKEGDGKRRMGGGRRNRGMMIGWGWWVLINS